MVEPMKALAALCLAALVLSGCSNGVAGAEDGTGHRLYTVGERTAREDALAAFVKWRLNQGEIHNAKLVPKRVIVAEGYRACGWLSQQPLRERVDRKWMLSNDVTMLRYFHHNAAPGDWRVQPSIRGVRRDLVQRAWDSLCRDTRVQHITVPQRGERGSD
jgi:hypothetical protein